jgi:hypothetical protein
VLGDHPHDLVHREGVEARERLVHDQNIGIVHEGCRHLHPLLITEREGLELVATALDESQSLEQVIRSLGRRRLVDAVQAREVSELLADLHLRVEPTLLGHVAEPVEGALADGRVIEQHLAGVGLKNTEDHPHRCCFAGAVAPNKPGEAATPHLEADVVDNSAGAEAAGEISHAEHVTSWIRWWMLPRYEPAVARTSPSRRNSRPPPSDGGAAARQPTSPDRYANATA